MQRVGTLYGVTMVQSRYLLMSAKHHHTDNLYLAAQPQAQNQQMCSII